MTLCKRCPRCAVEKGASDFSRRSASSDGLADYCKTCSREWSRQYRQRAGDHVRALERGYVAADPEKYRARKRDYYHRNRDTVLAKVNARNASNPHPARKRAKAWREKYPERYGAVMAAYYERRREDFITRARRRSYRLRAVRQLHGHHTNQQWRLLLAQFGNSCARCGTSASLTRDHIVPLSKGGSDVITNIQPLCGSCNRQKSVRTIAYPVYGVACS